MNPQAMSGGLFAMGTDSGWKRARGRATMCALALLCAAVTPWPARAESLVTDWLEVIIESGIEVYAPQPTAAARVAAVTFTAMYDAWAAYDETAMGVITGNILDGTGAGDREEAMSHAAYNALYALSRERNPFLLQMRRLHYDPQSDNLDAILGRRVAAAVLAQRRKDGSNQLVLYEDTSNYMVADPRDLSSWQPVIFERMVQNAVTPHWREVRPFALKSADQFRPPPPPATGTPAFNQQIKDVLAFSANLTPTHKAIAEFWVPWDSAPTAQLLDMTKEMSRRRGFGLDEDMKLFFTVANALFDAGIASWDAKYHYNYVRPVTAIRRMGDTEITAWEEDKKRVHTMPAREWDPYIPTPAFPEYVSGHSAFAAAWATAMELFMGSPEFNYEAKVYGLRVQNSPRAFNPIKLNYPTYWSAAEDSGRSRLLGGIHWPIGNEEGLKLGRKVGNASFNRAQDFINGSAHPFDVAALYLKEPQWRYSENPSPPTHQEGLMLTASGGIWTSQKLDPLPRADYALSLTLKTSDEAGSRTPLRVVVRAADGSERVLGILTEAPSRPLPSWASFRWRSDGETPIRMEIGPSPTSNQTGSATWLTGLSNSAVH